MEKRKKNLLDWARLVLVLAACDLVNLVLAILTYFDEFSVVNAEPDATVRAVALVAIGIALGVSALMIVGQIYVGMRGMREAKNTTNATGYIKLAKVLAWACVVLGVFTAYTLMSSPFTWRNLLDVALLAADAAILFYFVRYAKAVHTNG